MLNLAMKSEMPSLVCDPLQTEVCLQSTAEFDSIRARALGYNELRADRTREDISGSKWFLHHASDLVAACHVI